MPPRKSYAEFAFFQERTVDPEESGAGCCLRKVLVDVQQIAQDKSKHVLVHAGEDRLDPWFNWVCLHFLFTIPFTGYRKEAETEDQLKIEREPEKSKWRLELEFFEYDNH